MAQLSMSNPAYAQYMDFYLYNNMCAFLTTWRENGEIDDDTAMTVRLKLEHELQKRSNDYLNEMHRTVKAAFRYCPQTQGDHPEQLLWGMAHGNF